jgi:hypothetical protein
MHLSGHGTMNLCDIYHFIECKKTAMLSLILKVETGIRQMEELLSNTIINSEQTDI